MKIVSDKFNLEVSYSELKDIYEALKEHRIIEAAKYPDGKLPLEFHEQTDSLYEMSISLGLRDDFTEYDLNFKKNVERKIEEDKIISGKI